MSSMFGFSMLALLLSVPIRAEVANVVLHADSIENAKQVETKISEVTVFSDRANITRTSSVSLSAGVHTIQLSDLPSTTLLQTLRITSKDAKIIRIQPQYVERDKYQLKEIQTLVEQIEQLQEEIRGIQTQKSLYQQELASIQNLRPISPIEENIRLAPFEYNLQLWEQNWEFLSLRQQQDQKQLQNLDATLLTKQSKLRQLQQQAAPYLQGALTEQRIEVVAVLDVPTSKKVQLNVEYTITGASWQPTYDVHYDSMTDMARIETGAIIAQSSGENWEDVELTLSTSTPQYHEELPKMLTWTLGEKNEYVPQARNIRGSNPTPMYPPPQITASVRDIEQQSKREAFYEQRNYLQNLLVSVQQTMPQPDSIRQAFSTPYNSVGTVNTGSIAVSPPMSAEVVAESYAYDDYAEYEGRAYAVEMMDATVAAPVSRASRSRMVESAPMMEREMYKKESKALSATGVAQSSMNLALEASNLYSPKANYNSVYHLAPEHGLDLEWKAPGKFTVASTGQRIRIPLQSSQSKATSFYEATPSLEEMVYLKAVVTNNDEQALLYGPANIFLNKHFTTQGQLQTTVAGGNIELPLGADENIRIKRNITPMQRKEGVLKPVDITDYTVKIELANYKKTPVTIRVFDQIPITQKNEITIEYLESSKKFVQDKDSQGVLYWDVTIPAGKTETIELKYAITRPKNWKLWGY